MSATDQDTLKEWLDLDVDGQLTEREHWQLDKELEASDELCRERERLMALSSLLVKGRIEVRSGFAQQVVRSLPPAGWEAKSPKSWKLVAAMLLLLGGVSAAMVGTGSARLAPQSAFLGALGAVADLFKAAALAGAGMLQASWRGLGLAVGEMVQGSWLNWVALALVVVGLNALLFLQLRTHRRAAPATGPSRPSRPTRSR